MFKIESNLIKKGSFYTACNYRTSTREEFRATTGISEEEFKELADKMIEFNEHAGCIPLGDYPCIHCVSDIRLVDGYIRYVHWCLIGTNGTVYPARCLEYRPVCFAKNGLGIDYKSITSSLKNDLRGSCYVFTQQNVSVNSYFYINSNNDSVMIGYKDVPLVKYYPETEEIVVLNKKIKLSLSELNYLNQIIQNLNQNKKFMFDYLNDDFVVITA